MRWVIILLSSCGAQQLYTLLQRRKVVKRAHGRRTIGDGGGVGETETVRRDRDRASEKYLVVPLMETVPIYMCVTTAAAATAAAVRVVFVNRFVQYYYNTDLRCMCVCVCLYTVRERCTYRVRVCSVHRLSCGKRGKGAERKTDGGWDVRVRVFMHNETCPDE